MNTNFENFADNKLSIITYNYDRSLEYYFYNAISNLYGRPHEDVVETLQTIPIVHLHGNLGNLSLLSDESTRHYHSLITQNDLRVCIDKIKIIHENIGNDEEFTLANQLIDKAEIICFLGFGYDKVNLDRLDLKIKSSNKVFFGTTYELTNSEVKEIKSYFGMNQHGNDILNTDSENLWDVLDFLRNNTFDLF